MWRVKSDSVFRSQHLPGKKLRSHEINMASGAEGRNSQLIQLITKLSRQAPQCLRVVVYSLGKKSNHIFLTDSF